jgi:hypothetical protein
VRAADTMPLHARPLQSVTSPRGRVSRALAVAVLALLALLAPSAAVGQPKSGPPTGGGTSGASRGATAAGAGARPQIPTTAPRTYIPQTTTAARTGTGSSGPRATTPTTTSTSSRPTVSSQQPGRSSHPFTRGPARAGTPRVSAPAGQSVRRVSPLSTGGTGKSASTTAPSSTRPQATGASSTGSDKRGEAARKTDSAQALHDKASAGRLPRDVAQPQLMQLQARALDRVRRLFNNGFGDDGPLLDAVNSKLPAYGDALKNADKSVGADRPVPQQQRDALRVLLHTFRGKDGGDTALRKAVLDKLGAMGDRADTSVLLSHVQKAPTSTDLHHGLAAIKSILARQGSPQPRGAQHLPGDVKQLLDKKSLTRSEQDRVVEAVLRHGDIDKVKQHVGANRNEVYFVTFKQTVPGPNGERVPIKGVFKPENTYVGKEKAFFSREVSAYEFDRDFAKTGRVPVTVTALLSRDQTPGGGPRPLGAGSMQHMVPNAKPLGLSAVKLDPQFKKFLDSPEGRKQLAEIKTLLFVLNDPDKLPDPGGFPSPNWGNVMAQSQPGGGYRLMMIDNGGGQQALGKAVTKQIIPDKIPDGLAQNLGSAKPEQVAQKLAPLVGDDAASDVAGRLGAVQRH